MASGQNDSASPASAMPRPATTNEAERSAASAATATGERIWAEFIRAGIISLTMLAVHSDRHWPFGLSSPPPGGWAAHAGELGSIGQWHPQLEKWLTWIQTPGEAEPTLWMFADDELEPA